MERKGKVSQEFKENNKEVKVNDNLMFTWQSFWELSSDRHEIGPIPWSSIDRYARRWGIDTPEEFDIFNHYIRIMDNTFLKIKQKETDRERNIARSKSKGSMKGKM